MSIRRPSLREIRGKNLSRKELNQDSAERKIVSDLLQLLKIPHKVRNQVYDYARDSGRTSVCMADFRGVFSGFPVYMDALPKCNIRDNAGLGLLFSASKMAKQPFVKQYVERYKEVEYQLAGMGYAAFFHWPFGGLAVLHTDCEDPDANGVFYRYKTAELSLILEPAKQLADRLRENLDASIWEE